MHKTLLFFPFIDIDNPVSGGEILNSEFVKGALSRENVILVNTAKTKWASRGVFLRVFAMLVLLYSLFKWRPTRIITDSDYHSCIFPFGSLLKFLRIELVLILHHLTKNNDFNKIRKFYEQMSESSLLRTANLVFVISEAELKEAVGAGVPVNKINVVNPGFTLKYKPVIRRRRQEFVELLFVGTVYERKNIETLLSALSILEVETWRLAIAGKIHEASIYGSKILDQIMNHPSKEKIRLLGRVSDDELGELYTTSDLLILPSKYEGFGLVAMEAQAYGMPVIASKVGGLCEVIDDGETGILFPVSDVAACARAIELLVINHELRNKMSANAVLWSKKYVNSTSFSSQLCELLFSHDVELTTH